MHFLHNSRSIWKLIILGMILVCVNPDVTARAEAGDGFDVFIGRPAEGETYYSGPTSLMYSIPISGWVIGFGDQPEEIDIQLEILKNGRPVNSQESQLNPDGTFIFYGNMNPDAELRVFSPEQGACAFACHVQAPIDLPGGDLVARVTAVRPDGESASTEVHFTVDHSKYVNIPVEIVHAEESNLPLAGIPIHASTYLYLWRVRTALAATDQMGNASLRVEALSEAPTEYQIRVEPVVVGGVYYEGVAAEQVVLSPGAEVVRPVVINVKSQQGRISGSLDFSSNIENPFSEIMLLSLADGEIYTSPISSQGAFDFPEIPIRRYFLLVDPKILENNQLTAEPILIDLNGHFHTAVTLPINQIPQNLLEVVTHAEGDAWLPFAWIERSDSPYFEAVEPVNGKSHLFNISDRVGSIIVSAPGYYSEERQLDASDQESGVIFELKPQPDTQQIPWGSGKIVIPSVSQAQVVTDSIVFDYGWVWGEGGEQPLHIRVGSKEIIMESGRFALEVLPNQREWLYVFSGRAMLQDMIDNKECAVEANRMINLNPLEEMISIPYNPSIVASMSSLAQVPITRILQPTIGSQIRDQLKKVGVGTAQIITIVTYSIGILFLVVMPLVMLYQLQQDKKTQSGQK